MIEYFVSEFFLPLNVPKIELIWNLQKIIL